MTEDIRQLRESLDKLHAELEGIARVDPEVRRLLTDALEEIQVTLERQDERESAAKVDDQEESVAHRLAEAAREFEESHPTLSGMIGSVIDALSRMGI